MERGGVDAFRRAPGMIAWLGGKVKYILSDGCVLEVNGVGYKVVLDGRLRAELRIDQPLELLIHMAVGNDAITLYGFKRQADYELFGRLITVSGIGAKTALGMLSRMTAEEITSAIAQKNTALLTKLPGLGKKSVERLILELHDKLEATAVEPTVDQQSMRDAIDALEALGYSQAEISSVLSRIDEPLSTEELIKLALRELH